MDKPAGYYVRVLEGEQISLIDEVITTNNCKDVMLISEDEDAVIYFMTEDSMNMVRYHFNQRGYRENVKKIKVIDNKINVHYFKME